jgi:GNAT superfamily N-acetyltransferase
MYNLVENVNMTVFLEEAKTLLQCHWEELAVNKEHVPLVPDVRKYQQLQDAGIVSNICVYEDGILIGYSVTLTQPHLHYATSTFAYVDVIYIHPAKRSSSAGARLLLATEQCARDAGACVVLHHAKPHMPSIVRPLEKMGYSLYEHIFGKYIGE